MISIFLTIFESLRICLINTVTILIISGEMANLGLLKIKVFWKKVYNVVISAHGVINKVLSRDLYYIVDVVIWPKFGNSSTSMRELIITSIL